MSVVEVIPERAFYLPEPKIEYESHLLAHVEKDGQICLAGIKAVLRDGAPLLDWMIQTQSGIVYPPPGRKDGMVLTKEIISLGLEPSEKMTLEEVFEHPRAANIDKLPWTPASMVYGIIRANQARLGYR